VGPPISGTVAKSDRFSYSIILTYLISVENFFFSETFSSGIYFDSLSTENLTEVGFWINFSRSGNLIVNLKVKNRNTRILSVCSHYLPFLLTIALFSPNNILTNYLKFVKSLVKWEVALYFLLSPTKQEICSGKFVKWDLKEDPT